MKLLFLSFIWNIKIIAFNSIEVPNFTQLKYFFNIKFEIIFFIKKESELYSKVESESPNLGCDVSSDKTQGHVCSWSPIVFNIFEVDNETKKPKNWGWNVCRIIQFQKIFSVDNHCHYGMKVWANMIVFKTKKGGWDADLIERQERPH